MAPEDVHAKTTGAAEASAARAVWQVVKTFWSLLLGNALEWYEFTLYIYLEPYIEENFFQGSAEMAWLGFAITFVARPFGGVALGLIGDLFGRKVSTFLSIFGMLGSTVLQGVLPTFQDGPVAGTLGLCLLILLRLVQGISIGGEIASVSTYITEICHPRVLARTMVLLPMTGNVGTFCAQLVTCSVEEFLGDEAMHSWGWRLPFLLAILPGAMATLGRRCVPESGIFSQAKATAETSSATSKTRELLVNYWPQLLVGFGALAGVSMANYGAMTWGFVSLKKSGMSSTFRIILGIVCFSLINLMAFPVGYLTDRVGVACVQLFTALGLTILGPPLMIIIESSVLAGDYWTSVVAYSVGWGIFGSLLMIQMLQMTELFPVEIRNAGVGLSYNLGVCVFGGFAPMLFEVASTSSSIAAPGLLLALGAAITAITILMSLWLQGLGKIRLTHLRHEPYFRCCGHERFRFPDAKKAAAGSVEGIDAAPHKEEGIQSVVEI